MAKLVIVEGPGAGREFDIAGSAVIGRHPGVAVVLDEDPMLSRRHALVRPEGDGAVVEDLGSTNGTFVGGKRVSEPRRLSEGDRIGIGSTILELRGVGEASEEAARPSEPAATQIQESPPLPPLPDTLLPPPPGSSE